MLGKTLRKYRKTHRITQSRLSELSGVDKAYIARIENEKEEPSTEAKAKLINVLLKDKKRFRPERSVGAERGEQLGLLLSALPDQMAEDAYEDILKKLKEYTEFHLDLEISHMPDYIAAPKRKRKYKYMYYKYAFFE